MLEKSKKELRTDAKNIRKKISLARRLEAKQEFFKNSFCYESYPKILSYASFEDEFDMWEYNELLAQQGRLLLPKMIENTLHVFYVTDSFQQLKVGKWGIKEPDPSLCEEVPLSTLSLVFVPALAFDKNNHRLGYGKGCYDRFLFSVENAIKSIGIGYKEQLLPFLLPAEKHDVVLSELHLF